MSHTHLAEPATSLVPLRPTGGSSGAEVCVAALAARGYAAPSIVRLTETQLLMPGLIDGHVHAPQYAYVGLGTDCALMGPEGWLERHAFPAERRLAAEAGRARAVFTACVDRLLDAGVGRGAPRLSPPGIGTCHDVGEGNV